VRATESALPPTSVLDASALLAIVRDEPGASTVIEAIADGAAVSVFNWTEVLSVVAAGGDDPRRVPERLGANETSGASIRIESPNSDECIAIARLAPPAGPWPRTADPSRNTGRGNWLPTRLISAGLSSSPCGVRGSAMENTAIPDCWA
jgi:hypothetical protein